MRTHLVVTCSLLSVLALSQAFAASGDGAGKPMTPEQLKEHKQMILQMNAEKMDLLKSNNACIEKAQASDELRQCLKESRMAQKSMREKYKAKWEKMHGENN